MRRRSWERRQSAEGCPLRQSAIFTRWKSEVRFLPRPSGSTMANADVTVEKKGGQPSGPFKATVSGREFVIYDANADVEEGDAVIRTLPGGRDERYRVTESSFYDSFHGIEAHYQLKVRKGTDAPPPGGEHNVTIHTAQAVQVGDYNTQTFVGALQALVREIEESDASDDEKNEAPRSKVATSETSTYSRISSISMATGSDPKKYSISSTVPSGSTNTTEPARYGARSILCSGLVASLTVSRRASSP